MGQTKTTKKTLQHKFTDEEQRGLARDLAVKTQELRSLEDSKASAVASYGSQIKFAKETIGLLSDKVASGFEMREIECTVEFHTPEQNKKRITRTDTLESWVEPMQDYDFDLFNQFEDKANGDDEVSAGAEDLNFEEEAPKSPETKGRTKKVA